MKRPIVLLISTQVVTLVALAIAVRSERLPLGVPGEWEWQRVKVPLAFWPVLLAIGGIVAFGTFAGLGWRALSRKPGLRREFAWVLGLVVFSSGVQGLVQEGAPEGYGLSKWIIALSNRGSSGYYTVARTQMRDTRTFLADYPSWIKRQDALHVGTHPPGLFLVARGFLDAMEANPSLARSVVETTPGSAWEAIRAWRETQGLPRPDAASLVLTGALTLLACASTVVPLYLLARANAPAPVAWSAACLWPMVPSALMFQPTADTAFPILSTSAFALAAWARRSESGSGWGLVLAAGSGVVMAIGMMFTLAFLAVGLIVGLMFVVSPGPKWGRRGKWLVATGLGFLGLTLAWWALTSSNPFATWWVNQRNHSRFYEQYPRSYLGWVLANPVEMAVGLGLPVAILAILGFARVWTTSRSAWATLFVLAILTLSGRSLSEVARLWLPFFPPILVAASSGLDRVGGGSKTLAASISLTGLQVLILQATIQLVYPI